MSALRLLIVEDDEQDLMTCKDSVERYIEENQRQIELVAYKTVDEALEGLDNKFDGAIIDLKLAEQGDEGNQIIREISESFLRIPIAIFTGNPDNLNATDIENIGIFIKGESKYDEVLARFWSIYDTGLTRIMGGRGIMEYTLNQVFLNTLLPQMPTWESYGRECPAQTERALLRHTLNHLSHLLEEGEDSFFPEEVYLYPPLSERITTGSIVRRHDQLFVVLSPACDLVVRNNGRFKTDRILLGETEKEADVVEAALNGITRQSGKKRKLRDVFNNNFTDYYHWLPETSFLGGRFLNFRKLKNQSVDEFKSEFEEPEMQISPAFVKDIVSRFSSFYARQGQPDIENEEIIERILSQLAGTH